MAFPTTFYPLLSSSEEEDSELLLESGLLEGGLLEGGLLEGGLLEGGLLEGGLLELGPLGSGVEVLSSELGSEPEELSSLEIEASEDPLSVVANE